MPLLVADKTELETEEILARVFGGMMSFSADSRSASVSSSVGSSRSLVEEISESEMRRVLVSLLCKLPTGTEVTGVIEDCFR